LFIELWTCPESSSTRDLIRAVEELGARDAAERHRLLSAQAAAAERAVAAVTSGASAGFIAALRDQHRALFELGRAAGVPIVTTELVELEPTAEDQSGVLLPAGAGGGDIALFVGLAPSTPALRAALEQRAHHLLPVELAAPGVSLA
jgi:phosphomevalonate kinase